VVDAFIEEVVLVQRRRDPYEVGPILVHPDNIKTFTNSLHEGYSDLNKLELAFALALDDTGQDWCRNPSRSGYGIPLITLGATKTFYPDFLVWSEADVFALDTSGAHLLAEKTGRKLLAMRPPEKASGRIHIRFISPGRQNVQLQQVDADGFTVWGLREDGSLRATHVDDVENAVERALAV
jgi:type III restriction enzyme